MRYPERTADTNKWLYRAILPIQSDFIINLRLILHPFHKLSSSFTVLCGKISRFRAIKILLVVLVFCLPYVAHASFLNTVYGFWSSNKGSASAENKVSSQKMPLLEAPLSFNPAIGGGEVTIVDDSALESIGTIGLDYASDQISLYVVRKGDTISQIAKMFGVSTNTILWGNDLPGGALTVGQTLVILPISGVQHTVKSGDTIASIAKKYGSDTDEIRKFNDIKDGAKLAVGDIVIVPNGEMAPIPAKVSPSTKGVPASSYGAPKSPVYMMDVTEGYFGRIFPPGVARLTQGLHGYNGVDVAAPAGTRILASAPGTVIVSKNSGWNGGYGNYVVISHPNNTQTLYAHMSKTLVPVGAHVERGDEIGVEGRSGLATGYHVHFEVRHAGNPYLDGTF